MSGLFRVESSEFFFDMKLMGSQSIEQFKICLHAAGVSEEKFQVKKNNAGEVLGIIFDTIGTNFSVKVDVSGFSEGDDIFYHYIVTQRTWSLIYNKYTTCAQQTAHYDWNGKRTSLGLTLNLEVFSTALKRSAHEVCKNARLIYQASQQRTLFAKLPDESLMHTIIAMTGNLKHQNNLKMSSKFFSRPAPISPTDILNSMSVVNNRDNEQRERGVVLE